MSSERLQPLTCSTCRAPVPLGEADALQCPSCGATQALPPEYRNLRDAHRLSGADAQALDALVADIARPTPAWKQLTIWVGYGVGGFTLVVLAIGALIGAVAGIVGAAKLEAEGAFAGIIVALCTAAVGLISVPFVGELIALTVTHDFDTASKLVMVATSQWQLDVGVGVILYVFSVVPIAIARRTQVSLKAIEALRGELAARPGSKGGALECRSCGAPLTVHTGALAARCLYCETDNLVTVTARDATVARKKARTTHLAVQEELAAHHRAQSADRKQMWSMIIAGPLLVPLVMLGGLLLHALAD